MDFKTMEDVINGHVGKDVHVAMSNGDDHMGTLGAVYADLGMLSMPDRPPFYFRLSRVEAFSTVEPDAPMDADELPPSSTPGGQPITP